LDENFITISWKRRRQIEVLGSTVHATPHFLLIADSVRVLVIGADTSARFNDFPHAGILDITKPVFVPIETPFRTAGAAECMDSSCHALHDQISNLIDLMDPSIIIQQGEFA
jgi:hypothetical protein